MSINRCGNTGLTATLVGVEEDLIQVGGGRVAFLLLLATLLSLWSCLVISTPALTSQWRSGSGTASSLHRQLYAGTVGKLRNESTPHGSRPVSLRLLVAFLQDMELG